MQDASNESDARINEVMLVRLEGGQEYRENFELSAPNSLRWTWRNVSVATGEMPRRVLEEEPGGRELAAVCWNHDNLDGHNRVYIMTPKTNPSKPDQEKLEFDEHTIEISSTRAGTTRVNATASGPPLS